MNTRRRVKCDYCNKKKARWGMNPSPYAKPLLLVKRLSNGLWRCLQCEAVQGMALATGKVNRGRRARASARIREELDA